jgi:hypothetical protein
MLEHCPADDGLWSLAAAIEAAAAWVVDVDHRGIDAACRLSTNDRLPTPAYDATVSGCPV